MEMTEQQAADRIVQILFEDVINKLKNKSQSLPDSKEIERAI